MSIGSAIGSSIGRAIGSSMAGGGAEGALLAHWTPSDNATLYQTDDTSSPVTATGQQIGRANDMIGAAHATQSTAVYRPTIPAAGYRLRSDFYNDVLAATLPGAGRLPMVVNTPYGHYVSQAEGGASLRLPLNDATDVRVYSALTDAQLTAIATEYGTAEKYMVCVSTNTTIANLRIYTGGGTTPLLFVGANGATVSKNLSLNSDSSYDVSSDGLTAPVAVAWPASLITSTALTNFHCYTNQLTGSIPNLSTNTALTNFNCGVNQLTGSIPGLSANTALTNFSCYTNQLTGSIPSLSANTALTFFHCGSNQLTGSIPSLSANTALTFFHCYINQLTGSIPNLSANTALTNFSCYTNQLTGSIPNLSANTALTNFSCYTNQLTGYTGGGVSNKLGDFQAQNNLLTQAAVDAILADFVAANKTTGTRVLNLGGTGNATPSATGLTDKATLVSRGWTVTTN